MAKGSYTGSGLHYAADAPSVSTIMNANVVLSPSASNATIVAAQSGRKIRVLGIVASANGTATDLTLASNDIAVSPKWGVMRLAAATPLIQYGDYGIFDCNDGEALVASTGAVQVTVFVNYVLI